MVGWDWLGAPPGALESCGIEAKKMECPMRDGKDGLKAKAELLSLDHLQRDSRHFRIPCFRACAATLDEASRFGYINSNAMYFILAREPKQSIQPLFVQPL